jgi:antitoxin VapB
MIKAQLFKNGGSQAVRLPKTFRFEDNEVMISTLNGVVMLIPKSHPWTGLVNSLSMFTDDFMAERKQPEMQNRKGI